MNISIGICSRIENRSKNIPFVSAWRTRKSFPGLTGSVKKSRCLLVFLSKVLVIVAAFMIMLASPRPILAVEPDDGLRDNRTVEEGDIYRILSKGYLLNLNARRGVQVIDFTDVENPEIIGRLRIPGSPVETYVVGDIAYVLLNNRRGYHGSRLNYRGPGMVLAVNIGDFTKPAVLGQAYIPGYIQTSRLTRSGDLAALYVATGGRADWETEDGDTTLGSRTVVTSFNISGGGLRAVNKLVLSGFFTDIYATTDMLLVARNYWNWSDATSRVAVVDISDPSGAMVMGDQVTATGWIRSKFNMDIYNDVLRVVSGSLFGARTTNSIETFNASDLNNLDPIDRCEFGAGEQLFGTLFIGNKVFIQTAAQAGSFHAFEMTDDGVCEGASEFEVSGWNNYFRPVLDGSRLIGIGTNDEGGRRMAVSFYDVTDLRNPDPLLARAEVESDSSWSEASWDDRAFSVVENAVEVTSPRGVTETGLVLLPFSGWNFDDETHISAVQIFTFSESSLTRRGLMVHGTPVRRSFQAEGNLTANLSEAKLSLFKLSDPDQPEAVGRVRLGRRPVIRP